MNSFVKINFYGDNASIVCTFLNQQEGTKRKCSIQYGPGEGCHNLSLASQGNSTSNKVVISLSIQLPEELIYCFSVTASNGTHTVIIKALFNVGRWSISSLCEFNA